MNIKPLNKKLIQLTQLLSDGHYHDGNTLGKSMNITRSAIWKMIKKLEQYGIAIDCMQSKGYALQQPLILLEPDRIKNLLSTEIELTVLESIDSTNNYFKKQHKTPSIKCCLSEQQTHGRGRLNRLWSSPFAENLYLSCYYPFKKDISELSGLSLIVGLSVLATLRALGFDQEIYTKWPNDVLCRDKKIAGILIEVQAESHGSSEVTIGIGLNINMRYKDKKKSTHIEQAWTSLAEETGQLWDRNHVAAVLLQHLLAYVDRFEQKGFTVFMPEWQHADRLIGKIVTLDYLNHFISGEVMGINSQGHLLLRLPNQKIDTFSSGDVTLVKKEY